MTRYPRDFTGYGPTPPHPHWPGGAKIAVQIVLNYEEGGENNILHGDMASEAFLSEIVSAEAWPGQRHWNKESIYEYGARAGFWRLHRMLRDLPVTVYGVATALARGPEQVAAMKEAGWEIASHGLKWIEYKDFSETEERAHMEEAIRLHTEVVGEPPARLVHGPDVDAHRAARRRGGRLRLRRRQLRRRIALLDALRRA
jgi:peptidoglycan/xylan/chitin deacetylase (PgdA/CDA1 family)